MGSVSSPISSLAADGWDAGCPCAGACWGCLPRWIRGAACQSRRRSEPQTSGVTYPSAGV